MNMELEIEKIDALKGITLLMGVYANKFVNTEDVNTKNMYRALLADLQYAIDNANNCR